MTAPRTDSQDSQTVTAVVAAAARAAAALVPSTSALVPGTPVSDPDTVPLPPSAALAVTAGLSGEVSGDVVLVVSGEVVDALQNSPVGQMDVSAALRDPRYSSDRITPYVEAKLSGPDTDPALRQTFAVLEDWMVFKDPPDHTRMRRLLRRALLLGHSGMFPCFLAGRISRFERSSRSARTISTRVSCGAITASTYPRSAAM